MKSYKNCYRTTWGKGKAAGYGRTTIIEVVTACGLTLVPPEKLNPLMTTTFGVRELICDAIEKECREFIIDLGSTSTNAASIGVPFNKKCSFLKSCLKF
jgi:glycerate kinase